MNKAPILEVGTYIQIPLKDGTYAYGRVLSNPYVAFYNLRTEKPSSDLDALDASPILFNQAVRLLNFRRWKNIGQRELYGEMSKPVVRFMQDIADFRKCTIFDSAGAQRGATPEECVGLERAAVWELKHIEDRLLDTFEGRDNVFEVLARVRLK